METIAALITEGLFLPAILLLMLWKEREERIRDKERNLAERQNIVAAMQSVAVTVDALRADLKAHTLLEIEESDEEKQSREELRKLINQMDIASKRDESAGE